MFIDISCRISRKAHDALQGLPLLQFEYRPPLAARSDHQTWQVEICRSAVNAPALVWFPRNNDPVNRLPATPVEILRSPNAIGPPRWISTTTRLMMDPHEAPGERPSVINAVSPQRQYLEKHLSFPESETTDCLKMISRPAGIPPRSRAAWGCLNRTHYGLIITTPTAGNRTYSLNHFKIPSYFQPSYR